MVILKEIGIIFGYCLVGQAISMLLPFSFPGSIISMILLLVSLLLKIIKVEHIRHFSDFLLVNMAFFFIPAGMGIMENFEVLKNVIFPFLLISFVSTVLTFATTSMTVTFVMKLQNRGGNKK